MKCEQQRLKSRETYLEARLRIPVFVQDMSVLKWLRIWDPLELDPGGHTLQRQIESESQCYFRNPPVSIDLQSYTEHWSRKRHQRYFWIDYEVAMEMEMLEARAMSLKRKLLPL